MRAAIYIAVLLAINVYFVKKLFFVDFTNNMQTNAGSFMAISRFILQHWPHLDWFPWWFNGEPFENSYTPMLHLVDAAFAWVTRPPSAARTTLSPEPSLCDWARILVSVRVARVAISETSFFAALLYSLFSPAVLFQVFRGDVGGWWNPWRLRVLVFYGEARTSPPWAHFPWPCCLRILRLQNARTSGARLPESLSHSSP